MRPLSPVVQPQAVEEHDTWQHAFSDIDTIYIWLKKRCNVTLSCDAYLKVTAVIQLLLFRGLYGTTPTTICCPCRFSRSTLTAVGRSQLLVRWPGTLGFYPGSYTSSTDCFRRLLKTYTCLRDTTASNALGGS